jgi:hypothetical protein
MVHALIPLRADLVDEDRILVGDRLDLLADAVPLDRLVVPIFFAFASRPARRRSVNFFVSSKRAWADLSKSILCARPP